MASKDKNSFKSRNIFDSFKNAFNGICYGIKNTKNLYIDFIVFILVIIFGFVFEISLIEWTIVILCSGLVMSLEFVNTAIEEAVNLAEPSYNKIAKASKDVAAGAVLLAAIFSIVIGLIIFLPKFISLF